MNQTTNCDDIKVDLEEQFVLRLPHEEANTLKEKLKLKPKKLKRFLTIDLEKNMRQGTVYVDKIPLYAKVLDLPCITESYKTINKFHFFKTADISQLLLCQQQPFEIDDKENVEIEQGNVENKLVVHKHNHCPHGLTPPMKNVRKQRFRRVTVNKDDLEKTADVEKEILLLLRMDNEAVSTKFELFYEEPNKIPGSAVNSEHLLFGVVSDSDSDETNANIPHQ